MRSDLEMLQHRLVGGADAASLLAQAGRTRLAGRCEEADDLVRPLLYPHPADAGIMVAYALNAVQGADWHEALHRWDAVATAYPDLHAADFNRALVLRNLGRLDECDAMLCALRDVLPDDVDVFCQWCLNPHYMTAWRLAADRWIEFRSRWPHNPAGYAWSGSALRELGHLEEAKVLLDAANERFAGNVQVGIEAAPLSGRCGAWDEALRRWDALHAADPHNQELVARREEARLLAACGRADAEDGEAAHTGDTVVRRRASPKVRPDPRRQTAQSFSGPVSCSSDTRASAATASRAGW